MKVTNHKILIFLTILSFTLQNDDEIVQVILLFRNGSRFPQFGSIYEHLSPEIKKNLNFDPNMEPNQIDAILRNQLTGNGIRQVYGLSQKIIKESIYKDFLKNEIKKESDVYALASNTRKTLDSAQILLFGLLGEKMQEKQKSENLNTIYHRPLYPWDDNLESAMETPLPNGTYNFPIHSVNKDRNRIFLAYKKNTCKAFFNFGENLVNADKDFMKDLNEKIISKYDNLKKVLKELKESKLLDEPVSEEISSATVLYYFTDYLEAMRKIGVQFIPDKDGKESEDWIELLKISDYYKSLYFFEQKAMTVQLNYLIQNMRNKIRDMYNFKKIPYPSSSNEKNNLNGEAQVLTSPFFHKFVVYAGHDINIWAFLNNFGLTNSQCLRSKINDSKKALEDAECQGNVEFTENLSFVLKKPPSNDPKNMVDDVYIGKIVNL